VYATEWLHSAVVEVIAMRTRRCAYTTLQNWSKDVYNLVTSAPTPTRGATVEWLDANTGSRLTMSTPPSTCGARAKAEIVSVAFAGGAQHQDAGAKAVHLAPNTTSHIVSESVSKDGGRTTYRGLLKVAKGAKASSRRSAATRSCLTTGSRSDTYPTLRSTRGRGHHPRGDGRRSPTTCSSTSCPRLKENEANEPHCPRLVSWFTKELPMEYALEFNRLIRLEMEGSVG